MMNYIQLEIETAQEYAEILIAELFELGFEGFEERDAGITAFIPASKYDDRMKEHIAQLLSSMGQAGLLSETLIEPQNWNEKWEAGIKPQTIGRFYVTPTWGEPQPEGADLITLYIDPKMAFGTGYHATTRLILEFLPEAIPQGADLLDAGTGTGILGIAALKLGAKSVFGFDIDEWSEINCKENIRLNSVNGFDVQLGSTETIPKGAVYDVILANINKNILIELVPILLNYLKTGGTLILSGLLETDEEEIRQIPALARFGRSETRQQQEWIAILFQS